jgi:SAM-dependent methyltransferase
MNLVLSSSSREDLVYTDSEINRWVGAINHDFVLVDGDGPVTTAIDRARAYGGVSILDAGCGTGLGLIEFKGQVVNRTPIDPSKVEAVGVSLADYSNRMPDDKLESSKQLKAGYIGLQVGNLATIGLAPRSVDVGYAYQVLLHNETIAPILGNVLPALSAGGVFYCDTLIEQQQEIDDVSAPLRDAGWTTKSVPVTRSFFTGDSGTRIINKFLAPL